MQQKPIIVVVVILMALSLSVQVIADYGAGDYGDGNYGKTTESSPGSGGGGGSVVSDVPATNVVTKDSIIADTPEKFEITDNLVPINSIVFTSDSTLYAVELRVTSLDSKPFIVSSPSKSYVKIYRYIDIQKKNVTDNNIKDASITFTVSRQWLKDQELPERNIVLLRWKDFKWNELETTILESTTESVIFSAKTPGFSYFAIALKNTSTVEAPTSINPVTNNDVNSQPNDLKNPSNPDAVDDSQRLSGNSQSATDTNSTNSDMKNISSSVMLTALSIMLFAIILIIVLHLWRKKKLKQTLDRKLSENDEIILKQYIERARQAKMTDDQIAQNLRKARLSEKQIISFNVNPERLPKK